MSRTAGSGRLGPAASEENAMFKRGRSRNDAWEGVVTSKKRSSPDGQNMYHRITVTLSDGTSKEVRVRRALWRTLNPGDRLIKRPGETAPAKID
jgi:hypothetical protein